jgi:predicted HicB family RNase H-like nuclease
MEVVTMTRMHREKYTFWVTWSDEERAFIGRVAEYPSIASVEDTAERAYRVVRQITDEMYPHERSINPLRFPSPSIMIWPSQELYRRIAEEAGENGITLNALINEKLAHRSLSILLGT